MSDLEQRKTYLIVDGENIDATLGVNVLGHRPSPDERPRWDRISSFAETLWGQPVTALFFLNGTSGTMPMPFVQALLAMGYRPIFYDLEHDMNAFNTPLPRVRIIPIDEFDPEYFL